MAKKKNKSSLKKKKGKKASPKKKVISTQPRSKEQEPLEVVKDLPFTGFKREVVTKKEYEKEIIEQVKKTYPPDIEEYELSIIQKVFKGKLDEGYLTRLSQDTKAFMVKVAEKAIKEVGETEKEDEEDEERRPALPWYRSTKKKNKSVEFVKRIIKVLDVNIDRVVQIKGPASMTVHISKEKTIFVFGDIPGSASTKCDEKDMTVAKWMRLLIDSYRDYFFDIFSEIPSLNKEKLQIVKETPVIIERDTEDAPYLIEVDNEFEKCLTVKKRFCLTDNVRVHYAGFGHTDAAEGINKMVNSYKKYILDNRKDDFDKYDNMDKIYKAINDAISTPKMLKQINQISSEKTRKKLLEFIEKGINSTLKLLGEAFKKTPLTSTNTKQVWETVELLFITIQGYLMDLYLLARVFKKFDVQRGNVPTETQNVLIYVGDIHAERYRIFLDKYMGYHTFLTVHSGEKRCIKLPGAIDFDRILLKWKK